MRKILWLVLLAVPVVIVVTLPAGVLTSRLDLSDEIENVRGTVWRGQARWMQPGHAPLEMQWRWRGGRTWQWQASGDGTDLRGRWQPAGSGLQMSEISGRVAVARIDLDQWLINTRPRGFLELDIERFEHTEGRPPVIDGDVTWREARLEGAVHESLGEIAVTLEPSDTGQAARIRSISPAPVSLRGTIDLGPDHYEIDLWLRASGDRPDLAGQLARLGEVQGDGQVRIRRRGLLGW